MGRVGSPGTVGLPGGQGSPGASGSKGSRGDIGAQGYTGEKVNDLVQYVAWSEIFKSNLSLCSSLRWLDT